MIPLAEYHNPYLTRKKRGELTKGFLRPQAREIRRKLLSLGANAYDLWLPETRELPFVIHPDEKITGIVYGRYLDNEKVVGRGALVATDHRVILFDRKPLYLRSDEIEYRVISAVSYNQGLVPSYVTLHTRLGDFHLRTFNRRCAHKFVEAIEAACFAERLKLSEDRWEDM